jgi:protein-disulfide isomerase
MIKKIKIILFLLFISLNAKAENNFPSYGSKTSETKVVVKVFSSLTCPYCAEFHNKHLPKLIDKYVSSQKIMIELLDYPLDLAGLKAAQIQKCLPAETQKKYLDKIYLTQSSWSSAKTLKELETNLENIIKEFGISDKSFKDCLTNKKTKMLFCKVGLMLNQNIILIQPHHLLLMKRNLMVLLINLINI